MMCVSTNSEKVSCIQKIRGTNNLNIINFSDNCQLFIVVCYNIFSGRENYFFYSIFDNLQFRPHISNIITKICAADCHILVFFAQLVANRSVAGSSPVRTINKFLGTK